MNFSSGSIEFTVNGRLHTGTYWSFFNLFLIQREFSSFDKYGRQCWMLESYQPSSSHVIDASSKQSSDLSRRALDFLYDVLIRNLYKTILLNTPAPFVKMEANLKLLRVWLVFYLVFTVLTNQDNLDAMRTFDVIPTTGVERTIM